MNAHMKKIRTKQTWNGTITTYKCYHQNGTTNVATVQENNTISVHIGANIDIPVLELYNHAVGKCVGSLMVNMVSAETNIITIKVSKIHDVNEYEKWLGIVRRNILKTNTQAILYKYTFSDYYEYKILIHL